MTGEKSVTMTPIWKAKMLLLTSDGSLGNLLSADIGHATDTDASCECCDDSELLAHLIAPPV